ncbi:MAG: hypothetical protein AVDCRST_MAG93-8106, partial [uncultured Chloroflexia bacterium]
MLSFQGKTVLEDTLKGITTAVRTSTPIVTRQLQQIFGYRA